MHIDLKSALMIGPLAFCLGACGGGSGGIASTPPPPVAAPPPIPASTTSSQTVAKFPSGEPPTFYSTSHVSSNVQANIDRFADGTAQVTGIRTSMFDGRPTLGNFEYRGPDSYAVEFYGFGGPAFGPESKLDTNAQFSRFHNAERDDHFANLDLARNGTALVLTYSSFGNVAFSTDRADHVEITFFTVGSTTPAGQMPTSGSASYLGIVDGLWIDGDVTRRLYGSTARMTANFATGALDSILELRGHGDPFGEFATAPMVTLGTFAGTGSISGSFFNGTYTPFAGYRGTFSGQFFGPYAEEIGLAFRLNGAAGQTAFGTATGKR